MAVFEKLCLKGRHLAAAYSAVGALIRTTEHRLQGRLVSIELQLGNVKGGM